MSQEERTTLCWCHSGLPYAQCHAAADRLREQYLAAGERVPPRKWLKGPHEIPAIREAGRINTLVLDAVEAAICPGMTTKQIDDIVAERTRALGGRPTCLGFQDFPCTVCVSRNEVVCHGIPNSREVLREGDIVNVDCTTTYGGYVGDASRMFCIGHISERAERLVQTTRLALQTALAHLGPGTHLGDIGYYIAETAHAAGYTVVREIGGHGVGRSMHEDPYVCHVGKRGTGPVLLPGMIFTIEPMINEGSRFFTIDKKDGWTVRTADGRLSAQVEHTVLITESGYEVLSR